MTEDSAKILLARALDLVRRKYGALEVQTGKGIPTGQRFEFLENSKPMLCVVKVSTGGRISFARDKDTWKGGLLDADRILVVAPTKLDGQEFVVRMFDQKVVLNAFEENHKAQKAAAHGHLPNWIAPFTEENRGDRGVGDGFGSKALWSEPLNAPEIIPSDNSSSLTIQEAKERLAKTFNVSPDAIKIIIEG